MQQAKLNKLIILWLIAGIPLLSYLVLQKTLNLALYGDDWLQLYNLWVSFDIKKELSFFDIKSYLGAYWPQYFFLGLIRNFFGYQAAAYFAVSLLLKIAATISIFFLVRNLSGSLLTSFLTTIIFMFSAAGLQTTDWVFNMNTYAGIFFVNLALIFYLKMRSIPHLFSWYYLLFILFFTLALGVVPVRMHGAVPFLIGTEILLYTFFKKSTPIKSYKSLLLRILLPTAVMFILIKVGSFGKEGDTFIQIQESFKYMQDMIQKGRYDIFFFFMGIIGNIALPDTIKWVKILNFTLPKFISFTFLGFFICYATGGKKSIYLLVLLFNGLLAILGKALIYWNPLISINNIISIMVGLQFLFISMLIFQNARKSYPMQATTILIGLIWIIFFTLLYWLRTPYLIIDTTGRYMTVGAVGFAIAFAGSISIMFKNFQSTKKVFFALIPLISTISWLNMHFSATQTYLTDLEKNRNLNLANYVWSALLNDVPSLDKTAPSVFYFTYDNHTAANMILVFGFSPHAGLSYGQPIWENTPVPTEDYQQLLDMATTGKPMKNIHAREEKPVPLERIFAFDLKDGRLTNTTHYIRLKLAKDLGNDTKQPKF